jgi:hypothetical protein
MFGKHENGRKPSRDIGHEDVDWIAMVEESTKLRVFLQMVVKFQAS